MQVTTKAIVLSTLKYGDSGLIVKIYTLSDGLKTYLLKGVLRSKKGKLRPALFQPMTQLEIVATHKNKGTLEHLREAKVIKAYSSVHTDIVKNGIALFLGEFLTICIQEEEGNLELYHYLQYALNWLDKHGHVANFPNYFMLHLTNYLGFFPDMENVGYAYFDLLEGCFINTPSLNPILQSSTLYGFRELLGINFDGIMSVKLNNDQRQELMKKLLLYFELHLHGFRTPKSLAVLNAVFH